jgi:hypothetical protein
MKRHSYAERGADIYEPCCGDHRTEHSMNELEQRGVIEIRDGRYADTGAPADCGGGDGYYWYELPPGERVIREAYGPFASLESAKDAAATQPSQREVEAILDKLAREGLIECAVIDGEKWYWRARKDH